MCTYICQCRVLDHPKVIKAECIIWLLTFADMAPFYEEVCHDLGWKVDDKLLATMKAANETKLKQLDEAIEDAEKNLGETEIRDAMLSKAEFLSRIGDKVWDRA